ncbi:MAG: hypothetical protein U9N19_08290 [Thermodesulfobacteriota bacterium]|nr:hypothetical protein [Thermodesulfobacteriota bacterium]
MRIECSLISPFTPALESGPPKVWGCVAELFQTEEEVESLTCAALGGRWHQVLQVVISTNGEFPCKGGKGRKYCVVIVIEPG